MELPESIEEVWRTRATRLNARPVPGQFPQAPDDVNNDVILHSINAEWQVLVENLKHCIVRPPKRGDSKMKRSFGKERVKIGSQVLRSFMVSITLQTVLFGRDYNNFKENEIIINNKKRILIHIASKQRLEAIFTTMRQCGVYFDVDNVMYGCSGKVFLRDNNNNNRSIVGCVLRETRTTLKVKLASNKVVSIKRPPFDKDLHVHRYGITQNNIVIDNNNYNLTEYHPIRLLISKTRNSIKLTLNRVVFDQNDEIALMMT